MSVIHQDIWRRLVTNAKHGLDVLSTLSFDALNHILEAHHANPKDRIRYKYALVRPLLTQSPRNFELKLDITSPIKVNYESVSSGFDKGWSMLPGPHPLVGSGAQNESELPKANLRIKLPSISMQLKWPKLSDPSQYHEFFPRAFSMEMSAYVSIINDQNRISLFLNPLAINFSFSLALGKSSAKELATKDASLISCEDKFNDLILIALNEFSVELLPKLIQNIELPSIEIPNAKLELNTLDVSSKHITVAATLNKQEFKKNIQDEAFALLGAFEFALQQDIEKAGGFESLVLDKAKSKSDQIIMRTDKEIEKRLLQVSKLLDSTKKRVAQNATTKPQNIQTSASAVSQGFALGFNEYFASTLVGSSLPDPERECSKEVSILDVLKGKVCYWSSITDGKVVFNGTVLNTSVDVDFGGKLVACVRRVLDCSFRWDCNDLSLSITGKPNIKLILIPDSRGLRLVCTADLGDLRLNTNLAWPFNKVVEALGYIVFKFFEFVLNLLALLLTFVVIPVKIKLPGQNTEVTLTKFSSFAFNTGGGSKQTYIGYSTSLEAN